jgi:hypothetical protein
MEAEWKASFRPEFSQQTERGGIHWGKMNTKAASSAQFVQINLWIPHLS